MLATHEPGYFTCTDDNTGKRVPCRPEMIANLGGVRTIADAVRGTGARTILFSGHIHAFQVLDTEAMTQVIVGTGGANPDKVAAELIPPAMGDFEFEDRRLELIDGRWRAAPKGPTVTGKVQGWEGFGFTILTPATMELVVYDAEGMRQFACDLAAEAKMPRCR